MLYGNICFKPRVIGCTLELAESPERCTLQAYFVCESFTVGILELR
ncbi:MAG: hypothetical protein K2L82_09705 [Lachnospiraceae bacterium]|nr:hypothetical protein [Lachnospiraceae bacterium]